MSSTLVIGRIASLSSSNVSQLDEAMVVEGGKIAWIGARSVAPKCDQTLDFTGHLITPGLVDAHTHPVFAGNRSNEFERRSQGATYQEIAAAGGGIESTVRATRRATEDELVEIGKKYAKWFLANGTTTIEAKSGYGLSPLDEVKILRAIKRVSEQVPLTYVPTVLAAHAYPKEFAEDKPGYVECICNDILPLVAKEKLARYADAFCEDKYFDVPTTERVMNVAKSLGLGVRIHADQLTNCGGAQLAARLGAKTADHLEQTGTEGIAALKAANVQPVLLPSSVYCLGLKKYPDARRMLDEGLDVVLATDFNPGSSPTPSLPFVMSLACTQMGMTPSEALIACTKNAAKSLDMDHDRGSLEAGKRADFVVWNCEEPRELAYWVGAPLVHAVFFQGDEAFSQAR